MAALRQMPVDRPGPFTGTLEGVFVTPSCSLLKQKDRHATVSLKSDQMFWSRGCDWHFILGVSAYPDDGPI